MLKKPGHHGTPEEKGLIPMEHTALEGTVFNIERGSNEDGPGIRTVVFLKGCGLRCKWCANPESQLTVPEIMHIGNVCVQCGQCVELIAQDGGHGADVLGQLVGQGLEDLQRLGVCFLEGAAFDLTQVPGAKVGEDTGPAAQLRLHLRLGKAREAELHNRTHRQRAAPVHPHGAVVLDIIVVDHAAMVVGCDGDAAA